jgi:hypothetical protein
MSERLAALVQPIRCGHRLTCRRTSMPVVTRSCRGQPGSATRAPTRPGVRGLTGSGVQRRKHEVPHRRRAFRRSASELDLARCRVSVRTAARVHVETVSRSSRSSGVLVDVNRRRGTSLSGVPRMSLPAVRAIAQRDARANPAATEVGSRSGQQVGAPASPSQRSHPRDCLSLGRNRPVRSAYLR